MVDVIQAKSKLKRQSNVTSSLKSLQCTKALLITNSQIISTLQDNFHYKSTDNCQQIIIKRRCQAWETMQNELLAISTLFDTFLQILREIINPVSIHQSIPNCTVLWRAYNAQSNLFNLLCCMQLAKCPNIIHCGQEANWLTKILPFIALIFHKTIYPSQ